MKNLFLKWFPSILPSKWCVRKADRILKYIPTFFLPLQHQMDPTSNFSTYRQSLTAAMQRALSAQEGACDKIVIPFFSLLVKDLYFLNEGCSNKMPNGYLNFEVIYHSHLAVLSSSFLAANHSALGGIFPGGGANEIRGYIPLSQKMQCLNKFHFYLHFSF